MFVLLYADNEREKNGEERLTARGDEGQVEITGE